MAITIFPNIQGWIQPRTDDVRLTSENCEIILNKKIEKIQKVLLNGETATVGLEIYPYSSTSFPNFFSTCKFSQLSTSADGKSILKEVDITRFVVEHQKYMTLDTFNSNTTLFYNTELYKNNTYYYEHNSNKIVIVNMRYKGNQSFIKQSVTQCLLRSVAQYYIENGGLWYVTDDKVFKVAKAASKELTDTENPMNIQFRIYYTPLGESVKLQVPKTNPQANQFCIPYSQQQPIVDNVALGREMQSVANRAGCETKEIVRTLRNINKKRKLGTVYRERDGNGNLTGNVWRLTGERIEIYSETFIRVLETWSKNWAYHSQNVPINREFRSWNIPADIVQRNLLYQDYCLIKRVDGDNDKFTLGDDNSLLSDWAKKRILSFSYNKDHENIETECSNVWFYQLNDKGEKHGVVLSCSAFGFGNSLVFSAKTKDNLSAGVQRVDSDGNGSYQFCKDVYYCNDDGKIDLMYIQCGAKLDSTQAVPDPEDSAKPIDVSYKSLYMYPEFKTEVNPNYGGLVTAKYLRYNAPREGYNLFKEDKDFIILKDPSEQLNFTYQLHMLTDDGCLVIGSSWAANCPLVKQRDGSETIKRWRLKQYIPQGAQVMTTAYGEEYLPPLGFGKDDENNTITFAPITDEGYVGWCVTDANNNILVAFNDKGGATFKLHYTHDYNAIARALKK